MAHVRNPNIFEKILLVIGVLVIIAGYGLIHKLALTQGISWGFLQSVFLWLILIAVVILTAVNENIKEELKVVIENQLNEMHLIRQELASMRKKKK